MTKPKQSHRSRVTEKTAAASEAKKQKRSHPNPQVDVAAIALLNEFKMEADYNAVAMDASLFLNFTNQTLVGLGDLVFALGYPRGITSTRNNYPLAKPGHISSLPQEEFRVEVPVLNRNNQPVQVTI